jgi:uncharacterized membrane-anchored protein YitT (DUF2179 family)
MTQLEWQIPAQSPAPTLPRHRLHEDVQALLTGSLLAAFGILLFQQAGLLAGGTVGLALLLNYATGLPLSPALLVISAPFYALACLRMGREFTIKTFAAVGLTALFLHVLPDGLQFMRLSPILAAVLGGLLAGVGMLVLFRHRASLGGLNVLVLYLQEKLGWNAGKVQLLLDAAILSAGALLVADWRRAFSSILAVVVLNLVLAVNHRPGRYTATA